MDPSTVVESYADHLMEELFDGVDRALEGDEQAVLTLFQPPPSEAAGDGPTSTVLAPPETALTPASQAIAEFLQASTRRPQPQRWWRQPLHRYILLGSVVTMTLLGGLIALYQQRLAGLEMAALPSADTPPNVPISSDAEFLDYLRRAMEVVNNRAEAIAAGTATSPTPTVESVASLPAPIGAVPPTPQLGTVASGAVGAVPGQLNVVERVYIPYQPPSAAPAQPTGAVSPATAGVPVASQPSGIALKTHVLVGILELGSRSAALFEIDGVSQRVAIGESIGDSGWNLVSVSNQEAVIRRNGELQSIFVGQQF